MADHREHISAALDIRSAERSKMFGAVFFSATERCSKTTESSHSGPEQSRDDHTKLWLRKEKEKKQSSQTSASTWERKCASMWRPTTDAIKCYVNMHKLLTHWLDVPSRKGIKLVLAIAQAFIKWVIFGLFNQLCTASWFPRRAEPYATLVMSDLTRTPVTCCSLAQLSLI